jgi:general secretion pathway protein G
MGRAIRIGNRVWLRMAVAIFLFAILVAVPFYRESLEHTKATLRHNQIFALQAAINEYTFDQQKAPQSIQDLLDSGYLRSVPLDPFTGKELSTPLPRRGERHVFELY